MSVSPVMWGGDFAWGTLQVLLEAQVEGLADRADDVLGQAIRALQDVASWGKKTAVTSRSQANNS